jgi:glycerate kinase
VGAAGGLGFAFRTFLNGELKSGVQLVLEETGFESRVRDADFVVTGEGRLDAQTVMGKAPIGVARLAKKHGKKVIAFSGCVTEDAEICNDHGIDAFFPILRKVTTLEEALNPENAYRNLQKTATQVFRLLR